MQNSGSGSDADRSLNTEIVESLARRGFNATPDALKAIAESDSPHETVERLSSRVDGPVVTAHHVADLNGTGTGTGTSSHDPSVSSGEATHGVSPPSRDDDTTSSRSTSTVSRRPDSERHVSVEDTITGNSTTTGEIDDFVGLFRDRYEKLSGILRKRLSPRTVESLSSRGGGGDEVELVGMVNDIRSTSSGNTLVIIEDTTGEMRVLLSDDLSDEAQSLVVDEVVGVRGRLSDDAGIVFADSLHYPDVPPRRQPNTADLDRDVKAALISDIHFGSDAFLRDKWDAFTDWLHSQPEIEYVLVAGDLVEGVGVYPGQDDELTTVDLYEQYEDCADGLRQIPDDIDVITIPGNHDSVRLAEPQPALPDEFREPFAENVEFYGNPSTVDLEGVKVLMYHGMSLNPFVEKTPGAEIESPETAMIPIIKKRHLAPMYGDVRLSPETTDHLVIDEIPDILHAGHVHTVGVDRYNSVTLLNSGAWQGQTEYQKSMNIQPDPGIAPIIDLNSLEVTLRQF
ncbi:MAG: DNA-directed DNA polymerase II small subunit [Halobacteria archaeon]|nr:DNA-directed DNA polymerase II small subunit [Halobacteria archaeon]